jgi:heme/copper-type cytochrome/quinol oxidase subunit 3
VTLALPPAPAPERHHSLLVGTGFGIVAGAAGFAGLLGTYLAAREHVLDSLREAGETVRFLPRGVLMPEVPSNIMLFIFFGASVMAQWALYAVARGDRRHAGMAISLVALFGLAALNLQIFVYKQLDVGLTSSPFATLFYTVTGAFLVALLVGLVFAVVTAFRSLGGRYAATDTDGVAAFTLYWHFLTVVYIAVWLIVYINK